MAGDDLAILARGPALPEGHVWDSALAQAGVADSTGQGWQTSLTPSMGGGLTSTVSYTDATGAVWLFPYTGAPTAPAPYTTYQTPAGLPWALTTSTTGYTLSNVLTSETLAFDAQGRYLSDTDAYGNQNVVSYGASGPISDTNSGGRALSLSYKAGGLLNDVQSPLWRSSGGAQGQHVTYGYNGSGQLTTLTRGAGTTDALTTTFGYSGTQLISVSTPYTQAARTWTLSYDDAGRLVSLASPVSGTLGQAGYTPAYTTLISYSGGTTQVVDGAGTSGALTTTDTLDGAGEATQSTDALSAISSATYDADHDVLTSTDANGNVTTNSYQYVGPNGSTGLLTQTVRPPIRVPPLLAEVEEDVQFLDAALLFVEQADSAQALKEVQVDLVAAGFSLPGEKVRPTQPAPQGKGGKYHPGGKEAPRESPAAPALRFTTRDGWRSWSAAAPARTRS